MFKKIIYFSDQQIKWVQKEAEEHETSFTEMVRRILDRFYEDHKENKNDPNL